MTHLYITIDTEYSSGIPGASGVPERADNYARCIAGRTGEGDYGVDYQLRLFEEHGIRASFFVDPMPALLWGIASIEDIVAPILEAGQDVQLHCHPEWLALAPPGGPFAGLSGNNIKEFTFEEQSRILDWARDTLVSAGAPKPVAFRAGNYGANDDTLRALAAIGVRYDTSHSPALVGTGACEIDLGTTIRTPVLYEGVVEVPIGCIATLGGGLRHAQITALSAAEMRAAIAHARDTDLPSFTLVSHSFEFVNRTTMTFNRIVGRRFERLCRDIAALKGVTTASYDVSPPLGMATAPDRAPVAEPLPLRPVRTGLRMAEQYLSNTLYGAL